MSRELRPELNPDLPHLLGGLPRHRGYPVPWFVQWMEGGEGTRPGVGEPDFRIMDGAKHQLALSQGLCWVCGGQMAPRRAFVIGPMCAVNRTSAEPPTHVACGLWSARNCPFLARPTARRRDAGRPEVGEVPGVMIARNPGVAGVWEVMADRISAFRPPNGGLLLNIGEPRKVTWWAEGREATRAEVLHSIDTGMPLLREHCHTSEAHDALDDEYEAVLALLPDREEE